MPKPPHSSPYKRLWREWLLPYRGMLALGFVAMLVGALASAGYAKGIQWIITGFETNNPTVIWWGPMLVMVLTLAKGLGTYFFQTRSNTALVRAETDLQKAMHAKLIHADLALLQQESPTAIATRFTADIFLVRTSVAQIFKGVMSALIVIATVIVMLTIDWFTCLVLVAVFSIAVFPVNRIGARLHKVSRRTQDDLASMTGDVSEALGGIRMARTYQLETYLSNNAKRVFNKLLGLKEQLVRLEARVAPIMEILSGAAIAILLAIVAWRLSNGATTLANFMALMTGFGVVSQPARTIGVTFAMVKQGEAALDRVFEVLDLQSTIADTENARIMERGRGQITFDNVTFSYPDGTVALRDFSLEIEAGQTVAFVGRSGAGKSTIFNLLPRLYDVSGGVVSIDGVDIRSATLRSLREQLALVSQDSILLSGTIAQNIGFGRQGADQSEIQAAAKAAAIDDFITGLPDGYATRVDATGSALSGGQKQRLSIARAILRDAPILLLDEPTSALDAESEAAIRAALKTLSGGRTTLVIAHRLATIRDADRIVVLDQGRIVQTGTHDELIAQGGIYADLFALQFGG